MVEIVRITPEAISQIGGVPVLFPVIGYVGIEDGRLISAGGLMWFADRCWLWLNSIDRTRTYPVHVVRMARRMLRMAKQLGEAEVFVMRDPEPSSEKLVRLVGFEFRGLEHTVRVDGSVGDEEIWSWRP